MKLAEARWIRQKLLKGMKDMGIFTYYELHEFLKKYDVRVSSNFLRNAMRDFADQGIIEIKEIPLPNRRKKYVFKYIEK